MRRRKPGRFVRILLSEVRKKNLRLPNRLPAANGFPSDKAYLFSPYPGTPRCRNRQRFASDSRDAALPVNYSGTQRSTVFASEPI